ncbi:serine protease HTRA3a isoform X2 [Periophthalmus magnuspinnatus]|uniref:serine protease HTRA3a isoform X2 n=1 Tax=Periophthalmus magnuspinnatus TaxID=409849 RepID=UPI002436ECE8|nr:serine protease HTRA3a isoform X2 [Periophthalmus magnuspinnatus]
MQLLLFAVVFLFFNDLSGADKCASSCDVSSCPSPSCPGVYVPDRCNCCLVCSPGEGDPCGRKNDLPCGAGLECRRLSAGRRRGSRGTCTCRSHHPVCASDGKTYPNVCKMRAANRKAQHRGRTEVKLKHKGACGSLSSGGTTPGPKPQEHPSSPRFKFNFIADVVERIAPAVVHIELFVRHPLFGRHMRLSSGSGFIVTHAGVIVTNAHVVTTSSSSVTGRPQLRVQLHDGDTYEAVLRDVDKKTDIATIKITPQKKLPVLSLGPSSDLRPGEFVVAIGSPFALQNTVTTGIISTAQRDGKELGIKDSDMDYIQTDAIINYGNSGGPLVNLDGEVIGINTLKVTAGISFAIPSDRISRFLTESHIKHKKSRGSKVIRKKEKLRLQRFTSEPQSDEDTSHVKRRFLGIRMLTITDDLVAELQHLNPHFPLVSHGVLVQQVLPNSPAESGGLKDGDIIIKLNGQPVWSIDDIWQALQGHHALLFEILRGHETLLFHIDPQQ